MLVFFSRVFFFRDLGVFDILFGTCGGLVATNRVLVSCHLVVS